MCSAMKVRSSDAFAAATALGGVGGQHVLAEAHQAPRCRRRAAPADTCERASVARPVSISMRVLRIDETLESPFAHRVEGDDLAAALDRLLQRMQEARAVRAGVLAEIEDRVAMLEIFQHAGADRRTDNLLQRDRSRLVAHVGAVGQIVVAIHPGEQAVEIGRLERCLAGRVEDHGFRDRALAVRAPMPANASSQPQATYRSVAAS